MQPKERLIDFYSVGWVFLVGFFLVLGIAAWRGAAIYERWQTGYRFGETLEDFGFDLSNSTVDPKYLAIAGFAVDGLPQFTGSIDATPQELADRSQELRKQQLGKLITESDLVIGVAFAGEARAYPLRFLALHELISDTVGGVPVAVTYSPLSGTVAVLSRNVGDEVLDFGVSGLLLNSNLVLYDKTAESGVGESLWSQLGARAFSGPRVGTQLTIMPAQLVSYAEWLERHPDSTVLTPEAGMYKLYKRLSYAQYQAGKQPKFPVAVDPGPIGFDRVVGAQLDGAWHKAWQIDVAVDGASAFPAAAPDAVQVERLDGQRAFWLTGADGEEVPQLQAYEFAWLSTAAVFPGWPADLNQAAE